MTPEEFARDWLEDRLNQFHFGANLLREAVSLGWSQSSALSVTLLFGADEDRRGIANSKLSFLMVPYLNSTIIEARKCFEFLGLRADPATLRLVEISPKARSKQGRRSDDLHIEDFGLSRPTVAEIETRLSHTHCGDVHGPSARVLTYADKVLAHWTTGFPQFGIIDFPITANIIIELIRLYFFVPAGIAFPQPRFFGFQKL